MATVQEEFIHWFPGLGFRPAVIKQRKDFAGDIGTHTYVFVASDANTPYQKFDYKWKPEPETLFYTAAPASIYNQIVQPEYESVFVTPPPIYTCCSSHEPPPPPPPPIPIMESGFLMITCLMALALGKFHGRLL